jgi:dolichol-phosphate mannosyltransferase
VVVIIDCDLQDDPDHIVRLYQESKRGFHIVFTKRINRKHSLFRGLTALVYNSMFRFFADADYNIDHGSMVLLSRAVRNEFLRIGDKDRLYLQLLKWVGFPSSTIEIEHRERHSGRSTYSFSKLLAVAVQGWTSFSVKLLRLSIYLGFAFSILSFIGVLYVVMMYFVHGFQSGWASLFVLVLFSTGVVLISVGIAGIYIGKIFEQSKGRPLYIVEKTVNMD